MRNKILLIYVVAILLGVLVGLVGSGFQLAIQQMNYVLAYLIHHASNHYLSPMFLSAALSMLFVMIAFYLVHRFAPEAAGSGIQEIEGVLLQERPIYWRRLLPVKFIGGVLAISSKLLVGREGPTIQLGGNLGDMLGELLHIKHERRDTLIAAGAAAGLATAFNAPLAGVLFVIEEMRNEFNFNFTNFKMVAICCVMATITLHLVIGSAPAIPMDVFSTPSLHSLWLFFLLGILVGFAGLLFNKMLMFSLSLIDRLTLNSHFFYAASVGALVGALSVHQALLVGGGYEIIEQALKMFPSFNMLVILMVMRLIGTLLCYGTSVPGGVFAPLLALGTLLGLACFHILMKVIPDVSIQPGMFAVAGMGALFSAAVRAPITGIVLVVEMTQNYYLILPLMVCCLTATTVVQLAKNPPIYTQLLRRALKRS